MNILKLLIVFLLSTSSAFADSAKVTVQSVQGEVSILRQNEAVVSELGVELKANDIIKTAENAQVDIAWKDHWGYRLLGSSKCQLSSIEKKAAHIEMIDGNIIFNVEKIPETGELKVTTPVAVAAVRGTQFWGRVKPAGPDAGTTFAVREGQVEVIIQSSRERFVLHEGDALDIFRDAKMTKMRKALEGEMQAMAQADEIVLG